MNRSRLLLRVLPAAALGLASLAAACSKEPDEGPGKAAASSKLPPSLVLASAPAGAKPVAAAIRDAKPGDELVVVGRVGETGTDRANFQLVDASLKSCTDLGDQCPTPWDFCCAAPEEKRANIAMVEFRDAAGTPIEGSILGFAGLDHLDTVTVKGKAEKDSGGNVTIVATGLHRQG